MMTGVCWSGASPLKRCKVWGAAAAAAAAAAAVWLGGRVAQAGATPCRASAPPCLPHAAGASLLLEAHEPQLLFSLRVPLRGTQAAPLRSLTYMPGCDGEDCLLLFGGQAEGEPDMLTLVPLVAGQGSGGGGGGGGGASGARAVPWFGNIKSFCVVSRKGACFARAAAAAGRNERNPSR